MTQAVYTGLLAHVKETEALAQVSGILGWDQETMMPERGGTQRAEQAAAIASARHARQIDPALADLIAAIDTSALDPLQARNVAEIARSYARATRLPPHLSAEIARTASAAHVVWARARADNCFADFAPYLTRMLDLKREAAACLAEDGQPLYDALLDEYEPGMDSATLSGLLNALRPTLTSLRAAIAGTGRTAPALKGPFPVEAQMGLARKLASTFGYDFAAGRLDLAVHPFSSGTMGDARITTRVEASDPFNCLYSTIHEVGHAVYEQNIDPDNMLTPVGRDAGMGVHESQSRMLENQIGRSRAFMEFLYPAMHDAFGAFGPDSPEALFAAVNRVETGFIRTEADEVHYNLHVLLRFGLERDLIAGDLDVRDLEGEWNARFLRDFGTAVPDAARGVLQDVHWSEGLFGYFPTYSLGNIYAGMLFERMRAEISGIDDHIASGNLSPLISWLNTHIHQKGNLMPPKTLIEGVSGKDVTTEPLANYLEKKFSALYRL